MMVPIPVAVNCCTWLDVNVETRGAIESVNPLIGVMSAALSLAMLVSPPPATAAEVVTLLGALGATVTVSVSGSALAPIANTSVREQGPAGWGQLQPVPLIAVAVRPAGTVVLTVMVPLVAAV